MISGINSTNCIISSMAKSRLEAGMISTAKVRALRDVIESSLTASKLNGMVRNSC